MLDALRPEVHVLEITDKMKEAIKERGIPTFSEKRKDGFVKLSQEKSRPRTTHNERFLNEEVKFEDLVEFHRLEYLIFNLEQRNYVENNVALLKLKNEFYDLSDKVL